MKCERKSGWRLTVLKKRETETVREEEKKMFSFVTLRARYK